MKKTVYMLVSLILILGTVLFTVPAPPAQAAKVISGKTGQGAADFAKKVYNEGWKYVYGAHGEMITQEVVDKYRKTFPRMYTDSYYEKTCKAIGHRGVDCVGLLKAYLWWQGDSKDPKTTSGVAGGASAMYGEAKDKGPMSTMPDEPGIILYRSGHIGIYIGGGYVIDASGVDYGIKKNNKLSKWTYWFRSPYLKYSGSGGGSGVSSDSEEKKADDDTVLRLNSTGDAVKKLQNRLKALGYFTGTADGKFGSGTETSVKAFQKKAGLTADGVAGQTTQKRLYASDAPKADSAVKGVSQKSATSSRGTSSTSKAATGVSKSKTSSTATVNATVLSADKPSGTLKRGDKGDGVKALQTRLKELGYIAGAVDNTFGAGTEKAVKEFQEAAGLTADGVAGKTTIDKLFASDAPQKGSSSAASTYTKLTKGDKGQKVTDLQNRLKLLGYMTDEASGTYGDSTTDAVKAFQKKAGLTDDGVAGTKTQERLFADDAPLKDGGTAADLSAQESSEMSSEPVSSELTVSFEDMPLTDDVSVEVTEIAPPSSEASDPGAARESQNMIKTILIICIGAAAIVILAILFLEWRKRGMQGNPRVIRKDDEDRM